MKYLINIYLAVILLSSCGSEPQNKYLTYQNIVILSDMSDRLDSIINAGTPNQHFPSKDLNEISKIVEYFNSECVKPGEKIGDKSCISFSAFSEEIAATIDISKFKNLGEKQRFINCTGEYQDVGLKYQIEQFNSVVENVYDTTRNQGLDLISLLIEKISSESIIKNDTHLTDGIDTTFLHYENHIYIFTDGYLEYRNKLVNSQFYFGLLEIEKVRKYCLDYNLELTEALETNKSLCLPAYFNNSNQYINLHILETHERDKNLATQTYNHPTGQRDNEILEAVWRKWANDSGFKNLTWAKY